MSDGDNSGDVIVSRIDHGLHVHLNRAGKRNALTRAMYATLSEALAAAERDDAVRVVLFSAAGATFCGGNDMNDFMGEPSAEAGRPAGQFIHALCAASKVLVAAVQGQAVGIGATMLLHCDLVVAARSASLVMPFINLGLVPEAASSLLLPHAVGHRRAAEMLLLGEPVDAERALHWGLVNRMVADEALPEAGLALAQAVGARPAAALRMTKRLLRGDLAAMEHRVAAESEMFGRQLASPEFREAATAFLNKRSA